jgi:hypothetical protein
VPDQAIRFAVGDPDGLSSNSWRVWAQPDGDVYILCRDNYRELKVSLHGERFRVGLSDEGARATSHLRAGGENRAWDVWDRPAPMGGITIGYRILFLPSELALTPDLRPERDWRAVEFVPSTQVGAVTVATVTINEPGYEMTVAGPDRVPLVDQHHGFIPLSDGRRVQLTFHHETLADEMLGTLRGGYAQARATSETAGAVPGPTGRIFLVGSNPHGHFATEVNYFRPDPDPLGMPRVLVAAPVAGAT